MPSPRSPTAMFPKIPTRIDYVPTERIAQPISILLFAHHHAHILATVRIFICALHTPNHTFSDPYYCLGILKSKHHRVCVRAVVFLFYALCELHIFAKVLPAKSVSDWRSSWRFSVFPYRLCSCAGYTREKKRQTFSAHMNECRFIIHGHSTRTR